MTVISQVNTASALPPNYFSGNGNDSSSVLFVGNLNAQHKDITQALTTIKLQLKAEALLSFEQLDRLPSLSLNQKRFTDIVSGFVCATVHHDKSTLIKFLNALQPGGRLLFRELVSSHDTHKCVQTPKSLESQLKLIGFINIRIATTPVVNSDDATSMLTQLANVNTQVTELAISQLAGSISIAQVSASKPEYDNGTVAVLPQLLRRKNKVSSNGTSSPANTAAQTSAWNNIIALSDLNDALINEDELLDEDDLVRPAPELLSQPSNCETRVKSCKNCSCGRAELEALNAPPPSIVQLRDADDELVAHPVTNYVPPTVKSSCGSCYLGDAFRCSSCPYIGMPAFKPGEVVQLPLSMMQDDVM